MKNFITEANCVHAASLQQKTAVFAEHYPLHSKEIELINSLGMQQAMVFSAMDEPLFKHFGSDKMIPFMKLLGMKEAEPIEHEMVSRSISKGQEKIAAKVLVELSAHSHRANG